MEYSYSINIFIYLRGISGDSHCKVLFVYKARSREQALFDFIAA